MMGHMYQSYRFMPISCCCAAPSPLKFYYRPISEGTGKEQGKEYLSSEEAMKASLDALPLLTLTLAIYRGLPVPCRLCSPVDFQAPSGVACLDLGLGTHTEWMSVQSLMSQSD